MKRRSYDPMTDEWQYWDEPLSDALSRMQAENAKTLGIIALVLVLSLSGVCAALWSMMHTDRDTEQAALTMMEMER